MAQNTSLDLAAITWTQLSNADVSAIRVQNQVGNTLFLMGTVGAVAPTTLDGAISLNPGAGIDASSTLAHLFPGVAATRVYAYAMSAGVVSFSHA